MALVIISQAVRAKQREHERAVRDQVARHPVVKESHSSLAVAVIHPMLGREFYSGGPFHAAERNLLEILAVLDRGGKQHLIPDQLLIIHKVRFDINALDAVVVPYLRGKTAVCKRMGNGSLGKHRTT